MQIDYNKYAWKCPKCSKWRRTKRVKGGIRNAHCCGLKFEITTVLVEHIVYRNEIESVEVI